MSLYDLKAFNNKGEEKSLNEYAGKVLLIVNTATGCGFTPQYKALQEIYEEYQSLGFEILDFPCDSFLHQAPGSDEKINTFCTAKYKTTFERFTKSKVNGRHANEVFKYLTDKKNGFGGRIKWNFTKFLIDRNGNIVDRFGPATKPEKFKDRIKEEIDK